MCFKKIKEIEREKAQRAFELIKKNLPKKGKILVLSLTGSRAFGWAGENFDYDVHGIFAAKGYWDYVHSGEDGFDINLWELRHLLSDIQYQHFEFFMNISNPFWIHPKFNLKGLMKFCTVEAVKEKRGDILRQIHEFEITKSPRAALHAFRLLMVSIHFLKKRKFLLNVFKLNKFFRLTQLEKLKTHYLTGVKEWNEGKVKKELELLLKRYDKLLSKLKEEKINLAEAEKWLKRMEEKFY